MPSHAMLQEQAPGSGLRHRAGDDSSDFSKVVTYQVSKRVQFAHIKLGANKGYAIPGAVQFGGRESEFASGGGEVSFA